MIGFDRTVRWRSGARVPICRVGQSRLEEAARIERSPLWVEIATHWFRNRSNPLGSRMIRCECRCSRCRLGPYGRTFTSGRRRRRCLKVSWCATRPRHRPLICVRGTSALNRGQVKGDHMAKAGAKVRKSKTKKPPRRAALPQGARVLGVTKAKLSLSRRPVQVERLPTPVGFSAP